MGGKDNSRPRRGDLKILKCKFVSEYWFFWLSTSYFCLPMSPSLRSLLLLILQSSDLATTDLQVFIKEPYRIEDCSAKNPEAKSALNRVRKVVSI